MHDTCIAFGAADYGFASVLARRCPVLTYRMALSARTLCGARFWSRGRMLRACSTHAPRMLCILRY
eukprot:1378814-Rhodomonas_salina.1